MARNDPHFRLRIPAELKAEVERAALDNGRSINAEIVARLQGIEAGDRAEARDIVRALLWVIDHLRHPEVERGGVQEAIAALAFPTAEHHAQLFLDGTPVRQMQDIDRWERLRKRLPTERGLDDPDRKRIKQEIEATIEALLKPVLRYLESKDWDVRPPPR